MIFTGCDHPSQPATSNKQEIISVDTTPRITGIGGIFFYSDDPQKIKNWYSENLGLITDEYGAVFEFRNASELKEINYLRWSVFQTGDPYLKPTSKDFMINYRVKNIDAYVAQLQKKGVKVLDEMTTYEYGKFIHIMDIDGNKIELWEPVDSVLTQMGGSTNK